MRIFAIVCLVIAVALGGVSLVAFEVVSEVAFLGIIVAFGLFTLGVGAHIAGRRP